MNNPLEGLLKLNEEVAIFREKYPNYLKMDNSDILYKFDKQRFSECGKKAFCELLKDKEYKTNE